MGTDYMISQRRPLYLILNKYQWVVPHSALVGPEILIDFIKGILLLSPRQRNQNHLQCKSRF